MDPGDLCVCVAKFDCDVSLDFVFEADSVDARDGLDDGRLAVCDMADRPNVDRCLSTISTSASMIQRGCECLDMTSGDRALRVEGSMTTCSTGVSSTASPCSRSASSAMLLMSFWCVALPDDADIVVTAVSVA
jgi:hypothetical protein